MPLLSVEGRGALLYHPDGVTITQTLGVIVTQAGLLFKKRMQCFQHAVIVLIPHVWTNKTSTVLEISLITGLWHEHIMLGTRA